MAMLNKLDRFNALLNWSYLSRTNGTDRADFPGPPVRAQVWFSPWLNALTLPMGILQPPFFNPQYPASWNYGAIGVFASHAFANGFDDVGIQWDGVGTLASWMSASSQQGFQRMANCLVNQYNNICPLPAANYTPNCVNGAMAQGGDIADNGGMHAAWRAYKTYAALNGPDPLLPDPLLGQFTHDQLFFLSFARLWCRPHSPDSIYSQLLINENSPSEVRVFGIMQNFPVFQSAFNCPIGSNYSPGPRCNAWVLDNP